MPILNSPYLSPSHCLCWARAADTTKGRISVWKDLWSSSSYKQRVSYTWPMRHIQTMEPYDLAPSLLDWSHMPPQTHKPHVECGLDLALYELQATQRIDPLPEAHAPVCLYHVQYWIYPACTTIPGSGNSAHVMWEGPACVLDLGLIHPRASVQGQSNRALHGVCSNISPLCNMQCL